MDRNDIYLQLCPNRSITSVLGNLCNNPELIRLPDKPLNSNDFHKEIHELMFDTINNLVYGSIEREEITAIDIDNYLSEYPDAYKIWENSNGFEFITKSKQFAKETNYPIDYFRVKKFSLLREAVRRGLDVTHFYDYTTDNIQEIDESMKKLDEISLNDMLDYYSKEIISLRDAYGVTNSSSTYKAGDGILDLIEETDSSPNFGYPFRNRFYNTLTRGMQTSKLMLRSADSGTGKTRLALNDLIYVSMPRIWSSEEKKWINIGESYPALYIGTEEEKTEVDKIILATISGVNQDVIESGNYTDDIRQRLLEAYSIMEEGQLYIHRDDDFSIIDIEMTIERFIIDYNVQYVGFDYIQLTPKISRSALDMFGQQLREDLVIANFASKLKDIAQKYDVYITTSTQLNRLSADKTQRGANCNSGGKATQNKVDLGVQIYRADAEDIQKLEPILQTGKYETPNFSHWWYKNRGGKHPDCIIWTKMYLGNMYEKELFVTDRSYNLLDVDLTEIDFDNANISKSEVEYAEQGFAVPQFR